MEAEKHVGLTPRRSPFGNLFRRGHLVIADSGKPMATDRESMDAGRRARVGGISLLRAAPCRSWSRRRRSTWPPGDARGGSAARSRLSGRSLSRQAAALYWLVMASYRLFGDHVWSGRLVTALAAWLTVVVVYLWGRRVFDERTGIVAALVLTLFGDFVYRASMLTMNGPLALFVALGLRTRPGRGNRHEVRPACVAARGTGDRGRRPDEGTESRSCHRRPARRGLLFSPLPPALRESLRVRGEQRTLQRLRFSRGTPPPHPNPLPRKAGESRRRRCHAVACVRSHRHRRQRPLVRVDGIDGADVRRLLLPQASRRTIRIAVRCTPSRSGSTSRRCCSASFRGASCWSPGCAGSGVLAGVAVSPRSPGSADWVFFSLAGSKRPVYLTPIYPPGDRSR